jgi:hypothetical protein
LARWSAQRRASDSLKATRAWELRACAGREESAGGERKAIVAEKNLEL